MNAPYRHATSQDAEAGRKFCLIRVEVGSDKINVQVTTKDLVPKRMGKEPAYRFGPYGSIDHRALGVVRLQAASTFNYVGTLIDYVENIDQGIETAKAFAEATREEFVERLKHKLTDMVTVKVTITN